MIVFMGVAGSGKSAQGRLLADELGLPWVSTGEFLRMLISGKSRNDMLHGKLLDDEQIIRLMQKILSLVNTDEEFILDGFPRTSSQADWLLGQVKHGQLEMTAVIHIKADENIVKSRLLQRARKDDTESAIQERFADYKENIIPIIDQFKKSGHKIIEIDGNKDFQQVSEDILLGLKSVNI